MIACEGQIDHGKQPCQEKASPVIRNREKSN